MKPDLSKPLWWLAINGSSCAASPFPAIKEKLEVYPHPQCLIGLPEQQEQIEAQEYILNCPPDELEEYARSLSFRPGVAIIPVRNPEPQTKGPTCWTM